MKKNLLMFGLLGGLFLQACNSEKNEEKKEDFETVKTQVQSENTATDSTFQRQGYKVTYVNTWDPKDSMPVVFKREGNGDIMINKGFLNNASDATKAVLAYYSKLYNTGCDGGGCELTTALGLVSQNSAAQNDLIKKWFKSGKPLVLVNSATGPMATDSAWNKFTEIKLSKTPYEIHTQYKFVDDHNKETTVNEVYEVSNDTELRLKATR